MKRQTKAELIHELTTLRTRLAELEAQAAERRQAEFAPSRQYQYLQALHETALDLIHHLDLSELLNKAITRAAQLLGTPHGYIYLVEPDEAEIELKVGVGMYADLVGFRLKPGEGLAGRIWLTGQPLAVPDYDAWPGRSPRFPSGIVRAIVGVPLKSGERVTGIVGLGHHDPCQTFGDAEIEVLTRFAQLASIAIDNARLIVSAQQRAERMSALHAIGQALTSTLDIDQILVTLLNEVCRLLNIASSSVWLIDPATQEPVCRHAVGVQSEAVRGWRLAPGQGITGWVIAHGQSVLSRDVQSDPRHFFGVDQKSGLLVRSMMSVPLKSREQVIGTINVVDTSVDRFTPDDRTLLELLAASAAIAIDNARLVETLKRHAAELEARNEELDAFAHTVAHDLNSPLTNVIGHAETLEMYHTVMSAEDQEKSLQAIASNARKMNNIINELLLLSGVRKTEAKLAPLDMVNILAESMKRLDDLIQRHCAEIQAQDVHLWPKAIGYAPWVEEVWINYISNAIRYGGIPPRIELGAVRQADDMVRFWVRDNGDGLLPEAQARLFIPFTRLDQIRAKGHGLGLSIVQRIVTKLGGQVGVESNGQPGHGCTFFFTLPAAD